MLDVTEEVKAAKKLKLTNNDDHKSVEEIETEKRISVLRTQLLEIQQNRMQKKMN